VRRQEEDWHQRPSPIRAGGISRGHRGRTKRKYVSDRSFQILAQFLVGMRFLTEWYEKVASLAQGSQLYFC
jgi:hypothetical protein